MNCSLIDAKWVVKIDIIDKDSRNNFLKSFLDFASFGGITFDRKLSVYLEKSEDNIVEFDKAVLGIYPGFSNLNKILVLHPSIRKRIYQVFLLTKFISSVAMTAPLSADIYFVSSLENFGKILRISHDLSKKYSAVFPEEEFKRIDSGRVGYEPSVNIDVNDKNDTYRAALVFAALTSGVHRHGFALRQVAAQELMEAILEGKAELVGLLAAIYVDAYLWYTYEAARKAPVAGEELLHSILSGNLLGIGRKLLERYSGKEIVCMYRAAVASLAGELGSAARKVGGSGDVLERVERFTREVWGVARNVLRRITDNVVGGSGDAVLGRVGMVAGELKGRLGEASCMVVPLTEQTSPAFVGMLWRALGGPGCVRVVYTPQTLYNRLLFEYFSPFGGRGGSVDVEFIPVMGLEPRVTYEVIRGLAGELEEKGFRGKEEVFVLGQGNMAVFLSLLSLVETLDASFKGL